MHAQLLRISENSKSSNVKEIIKPYLEKPYKPKVEKSDTSLVLKWMQKDDRSEAVSQHSSVSLSLRKTIKEDHGS